MADAERVIVVGAVEFTRDMNQPGRYGFSKLKLGELVTRTYRLDEVNQGGQFNDRNGPEHK